MRSRSRQFLTNPPDSVETNPTLQLAPKAKNGHGHRGMAKSAAFAQKHGVERASAGARRLAIGASHMQRKVSSWTWLANSPSSSVESRNPITSCRSQPRRLLENTF
jgi:hypothetical protein